MAQRAGLSRNQAATLIANGNVTVNGKREKAAYRPVTGDLIVVEVPSPPSRELTAESIPLAVVYEDEWLLVVDKPPGMVVHPAPGNWSGTLVNALLGRGSEIPGEAPPERAGIVHRLDKDTSGLLIVAKTDRAHRILGAALAARRVHRRYAVMIRGHLAQDTLSVDRPIARDPRDRKRMAIVSSGRLAKTDFIRLARFEPGDFLRAQLHTGRTHQIRVHLASIGHPVIGDDTYGDSGSRPMFGLPPRRHFLHAAWLVFTHPITGAAMDIRSPLPPDLSQALRTIAQGSELAEADDQLAALRFYD